jgi:hypothetical protein
MTFDPAVFHAEFPLADAISPHLRSAQADLARLVEHLPARRSA